MKNWIVIAVVGCFFSLTTAAQEKKVELTEAQKEEFVEEMKEYFQKLDLSEQQKASYQEIALNYAPQFKAIKESNASKMSKYRKVKMLRSDKDAEMKKILDDRQFNLYLEMQEERKKKWKENRKK